MKRPNKENIKVQYRNGVAEISSVVKQYSRQQDKYIDYLESELIKLNKSDVSVTVCGYCKQNTVHENYWLCKKCIDEYNSNKQTGH